MDTKKIGAFIAMNRKKKGYTQEQLAEKLGVTNKTISRWESVRRGEDKWIFPFQENADVMFNSAMIYELAAIRRHAEPILTKVPRTAPEYAEAYRLLKFLSYFNYLTDREMPPTSLLREFLGGSSFRY